jgi:ribonuclease BN (tRNA processing enzyme)
VDGAAKLLVDMGGGAALRFEQSGASVNTLDAVLFSHFHVDHSADFPALIKASFFTDRDRDLPIYGPDGNELMPSAEQFVNALFGRPAGAFAYLSDFVALDVPGSYKILAHNVSTNDKKIKHYKVNKNLDVSSVAVLHGQIPALAWRLDVDGHSAAFSGDMNGENQTLPILAKEVGLLIAHNAIPEKIGGVARRLHMPPSVIGTIAKRAEVKTLVLSHRMNRTLGVEKETQSIINGYFHGRVSFANDLDCFEF